MPETCTRNKKEKNDGRGKKKLLKNFSCLGFGLI